MQATDTAGTTVGDDDDRKCRICFDEDETEDNPFVSPCKCQGSQSYIHMECLQKWQRSVLLGQPNHPAMQGNEERHLICNVCRAPFNVAPPKRIDMLSAISEISWDRIKPGLLLVSTESMDSSFSPEIPSAWQALFEARRAHWKRSVYLITAVESFGEPGGGDAVQGVNLTRNTSHQVQMEVLRTVEAAVGAGGGRADVKYFNGGPVAPSVPLAACVLDRSQLEQLEQFGVGEVLKVGEARALAFGRLRPMLALASVQMEEGGGSGAMGEGDAAEGEEMAVEGGEEAEAEGGGEARGPGREGRVALRVWSGHATWNRQQLMGEIARGSWGICDALPEDVGAGARGLGEEEEEEEEEEEAPGALWQRLVESGRVAYAKENALREQYEQSRRAWLESVPSVTVAGLPSGSSEEEEDEDEDEDEDDEDEDEDDEDEDEEDY